MTVTTIVDDDRDLTVETTTSNGCESPWDFIGLLVDWHFGFWKT